MKLYTCLLFGEGKDEKNFLYKITSLKKFQFHTKKWSVKIDNASGESPYVIIEKCSKINHGYDLTVCFIDFDIIKRDANSVRVKDELEKKAEKYEINIIWQINDLEDEFEKVIGKIKGKREINKKAQENPDDFVNKYHWNKILNYIKREEEKLDNIKK